ncbi:MAG TPA: hypothetical protein VFA33_01730 [Bryobacteraceae bacterium]|nr:hypothetical protein [Bryobacteraceae bacterium]
MKNSRIRNCLAAALLLAAAPHMRGDGGTDSDTASSAPAPPAPSPAPSSATAAPAPAQAPQNNEGRVKVTPYGRVELDGIYSSRGTNPLDPRQFNGYSTAAGPEPNSSSTFNPRFTVLGLVSNYTKDDQSVQARIEFDFYSTDQANLFTPRLRLAYIQYSKDRTKVTAGMDWVPVASLLPDILDFSIMGYGGNLWQRIPQVTVRQALGKHWEVLGTVMRFERGFTLQPRPYVSDPFNDPVKMPYLGTRIAYQNWGAGGQGLLAVSGAYRQFTVPSTTVRSRSDLVNIEWVLPLTKGFHWSGKLGHGQALGDEFFRFGQALNGVSPIRTTVGYSELSYSHARWAFASGWGDDDPNNKDLHGISNNNLNYKHNQRVFANTVYDAFAHVKLGFEYNYLRTNWTNGDLFTGNQVMASIFYSFGQEEK